MQSMHQHRKFSVLLLGTPDKLESTTAVYAYVIQSIGLITVRIFTEIQSLVFGKEFIFN